MLSGVAETAEETDIDSASEGDSLEHMGLLIEQGSLIWNDCSCVMEVSAR
jgi:hypothetical protein